MALLFGTDGKLWPAGQLVRRVSTEADLAFEAGTLPSWLTHNTSGTDAGSAVAASSNTVKGTMLTPATGINNTATIFGPELTFSQLRRVRFDVTFTGGGRTIRDVSIGFQGAASGAWIANHGGELTDSYVYRRTTGPTDAYTATHYSFGTSSGTNGLWRFPLSVIVDPYDGTIAIAEHDGIYWHNAYGSSALGTGTVKPFVRVTMLDGSVPLPLHLHHVALTREWL